jgi:putative oxidoreductase
MQDRTTVRTRKVRRDNQLGEAIMNADIDRSRLHVPAVAGLYETLAPMSYTLIRVALGLILIPHGFNKLFLSDAVPASRNFVNFGWAYPLAWAYFIGALEFFGGILLAVGLYTRIIAAAFVIEMSVICFAVLWPNWSWGRRGMEYALFMGIVALAIFFRGGGRWSLDNLMRKEF